MLPIRGDRDGRQFLTTDEESSGIIDMHDKLGPGWYLADVQSHISLDGTKKENQTNRKKLGLDLKAGQETVEDGQLLAIYVPNDI